MKTQLLLILLLCALMASSSFANTPPQVSNVVAIQRDHVSLVDISYTVFDADGDNLFITIWYSDDGGVTWDNQCQSITGDVGLISQTTANLTATWDVGIDLPDFINNQFALRVYADDSHDLDDFVYIPPGTFMMGSSPDEVGHYACEDRHRVTLTKAFWMSPYAVTEDFWDEVMDLNPTGSNYPKTNISWNQAVEFCNILSAQRGLAPAYTIIGSGHVSWNRFSNGYRLLTEAEFEYAGRAGSTTGFSNGPVSSVTCYDPVLALIGRNCGNSDWHSWEVGSLIPNAWGLYDMHGGVWEFCWDVWSEHLGFEAVTDPVTGGYDQNTSADRIDRGGCWGSTAQDCRSASRNNFRSPTNIHHQVGFRLARSVR